MQDWVEVGPVADLVDMVPTRVTRGALGGFVVLIGDSVRAYSEVCPHREYGAVSQGTWNRGVLTCPLHFWRFDVATGRSLSGDATLEDRIRSYVRWNAMAMVVRANKHTNVGGHIASYASAAELFEIGFNHCFRADAPDASTRNTVCPRRSKT